MAISRARAGILSCTISTLIASNIRQDGNPDGAANVRHRDRHAAFAMTILGFVNKPFRVTNLRF